MRVGDLECSSALLVQLQREALMVSLLHEMGRLTRNSQLPGQSFALKRLKRTGKPKHWTVQPGAHPGISKTLATLLQTCFSSPLTSVDSRTPTWLFLKAGSQHSMVIGPVFPCESVCDMGAG